MQTVLAFSLSFFHNHYLFNARNTLNPNRDKPSFYKDGGNRADGL